MFVFLGRDADTASLGLAEAQVKLDPSTGKVMGDFGSEAERSSVANIFAVGDVLHVSQNLLSLIYTGLKPFTHGLHSEFCFGDFDLFWYSVMLEWSSLYSPRDS